EVLPGRAAGALHRRGARPRHRPPDRGSARRHDLGAERGRQRDDVHAPPPGPRRGRGVGAGRPAAGADLRRLLIPLRCRDGTAHPSECSISLCGKRRYSRRTDCRRRQGEMQQQASGWRGRTRRVFAYGRAYTGSVVVILALTLVVAAVNAVEPLLMKYLFDELAAGAGARALALGVGVLLAVGVAREVIGGVSHWLTWRVRLCYQYGLLEATVGRLHTLPLAYHRGDRVGAIMTRLARGISGFVGALTEIGFNVVPTLVYLGISLVFMLRLDWRLTLVVLLFTPLPAFVGWWAAKEQTVRERVLLERWSQIYSRFNEVLAGIATVKSFAMEEAEKRRFLRGVDGANAVVIRGVRRDTGVGAVKNLLALAA